MQTLDTLRHTIQQATYQDESEAIDALIKNMANIPAGLTQKASEKAQKLIENARRDKHQQPTLEAFIKEFGLTNNEGIALMCIAESLLRIPDSDTADKLIAENIHMGNWAKHLGHSDSLFVEASTWGLILTGKIVPLNDEILNNTVSWFENLTSRISEPIVRRAMKKAISMMADHYIFAESIETAMDQASRSNVIYSFDMLGEGARTQKDSDYYYERYLYALKYIGNKNQAHNVHEAHGISVKLSALHPRYEYTQHRRVIDELLPKILHLAVTAKKYNIGLNIDAEESWRLDLSLDIFEALAKNEQLNNWDGLGFVLQTYQKRAIHIVNWLATLSKETRKRFMIRLVKGAYWDTEIKHAQQTGAPNFPVFTQKQNTDVSFLVCAQKILEYPEQFYAQFATHNAHTLSFLSLLTEGQKHFEYQRLHGMGELLHRHFSIENDASPVRVYAPIGNSHELLPYLVRRLLENGANSSFVHSFLDENIPAQDLVLDPVHAVSRLKSANHPLIQKPSELYKYDEVSRQNSLGYDINETHIFTLLKQRLEKTRDEYFSEDAYLQQASTPSDLTVITSPCDKKVRLSHCMETPVDQLDAILQTLRQAQPDWDAKGGASRAKILKNAAQHIEDSRDRFLFLLTHEAGRCVKDAIEEIREAADFCRYYARLAEMHFDSTKPLKSPTGETNTLGLHGRGIFFCISPWNFPLAIFIGQVTGALAAGNTVIAKPAEQTPLIALEAVKLLHSAGVPDNALQCVVGGKVLAQHITECLAIDGVAFTGSTETAKKISLQLAQKDGPIIPLIAETGGQNAMIVDSTALPEQVVDDTINSAFGSAGQRCSAARILFLQDDVADTIISMLKGACDELTIGVAWQLHSDIGPIIDETAYNRLSAHIERMEKEANILYRYPKQKLPKCGFYMGPHIIEIESLNQLTHEVFGPILHIVRFTTESLDQVIEDINQTGFGLTLGIHTRLESRAKDIAHRVRVGNVYINRNTTGAVVGVNPFGGQGLSGTGPKAGGPHYLFRFSTEKTITNNISAKGGNTELATLI